MTIYVLRRGFFTERITAFHYKMFHGEAERAGVYIPRNLGEDLSQPLLLRRNGTRIPDVFWPCTSLVVADAVRHKLNHFKNTVFLGVVFKKLIEFPYQAGDMSYYRRPAFLKNPRREDPEKLIQRLPDIPALHRSAGRYYELIVASHDKLIEERSDLRPVVFDVTDLDEKVKAELPLSADLVTEYPILETRMTPGSCSFILKKEAFDLLSSHIDGDYFEWSSAEV